MPEPKRQALLVVGMHRSGTSAMARTLSLSGAALPLDVMGSSAFNAKGHWEPIKIAAFNDEILRSLDISWESPFGPRRNRTGQIPLERFHDQARAIVREQYNGAPLIVLKDPRTSLLIDFWENVLTAEGYGCSYVMMLRNPHEVAASLRKRDELSASHTWLLWATHMTQAELTTRGKRRIVCRFDDLLSDPAAMLDRLEDQLGIAFPRRTAAAEEEIARFLEPSLRHHQSITAASPVRGLDRIEQLYDYFSKISAGQLPNEDVPLEVSEWLRSLESIVSPLLIDQGRRYSINLDQVQNQLAQQQASQASERLEAEASFHAAIEAKQAVEAEMARLADQMATLTTTVTELQIEAERLRTNYDTSTRRSAELECEVVAVRGDNDDVRAALNLAVVEQEQAQSDAATVWAVNREIQEALDRVQEELQDHHIASETALEAKDALIRSHQARLSYKLSRSLRRTFGFKEPA